jgi:hypothetical protein
MENGEETSLQFVNPNFEAAKFETISEEAKRKVRNER